MKKLVSLVSMLSSILIGSAVSSLAQSWVATSAPNYNWNSIACSADGQRVVAVANSGQIYTSTNAGANWQSNLAPSLGWSWVVSTADGVKLAAICKFADNSQVYTSTNGGVDWSPGGSPTNNWLAVIAVPDGSRLIATPDLTSYYSSDWGQTWVPGGATGDFPESGASSSNGNMLVLVGDGIHTSTNGGLTWTQTSAKIDNWFAVGVSADGSKMLAGANSGDVHRSSDFGSNWVGNNVYVTQANASPAWCSVAMSADGSHVGIASWDGWTLISTNSGALFTYDSYNLGGAIGNSMAASADFSIVYRCARSHIYKLDPQPPLQIFATNGNLTLTWLDSYYDQPPLQSNSDLTSTNWVTITNTPTDTNGQYQVVLPVTTGNAYFRLSYFWHGSRNVASDGIMVAGTFQRASV